MLKRNAVVVGAGLVGVTLLAGCSSSDASGTSPVAATSTSTSGPSSPEAAQERAVPEQVIACQPGMVDTFLTVDDVPTWPGPPPSDFMEPKYPSGLCGTLTGSEAEVAYEAAVKHPAALLEEGRVENGEGLSDTNDALWAVEGVVTWLVVEPQW